MRRSPAVRDGWKFRVWDLGSSYSRLRSGFSGLDLV